jgi:hypothetical protein
MPHPLEMTDAEIIEHYHAKLEAINDILKTDDAAVFEDVLYDMARTFVTARECDMALTIRRIWDITHPMFCAPCGKPSAEWAKEGLNALKDV